MIEYDDTKNRINIAKHGLSFNAVEYFEWNSAIIVEDNRADYGEKRYRALGMINDRLHGIAFVIRRKKIRVISLRKANKREEKQYEETRQKQPRMD